MYNYYYMIADFGSYSYKIYNYFSFVVFLALWIMNISNCLQHCNTIDSPCDHK